MKSVVFAVTCNSVVVATVVSDNVKYPDCDLWRERTKKIWFVSWDNTDAYPALHLYHYTIKCTYKYNLIYISSLKTLFGMLTNNDFKYP